MLRGTKARIGVIVLSILVLCGSTIGVMNVFADPNQPDMYYRIEPSEVVELDGTNAGEFSVSVIPIGKDILIHSFGGTFPANNPYITAVECGAEKSDSLAREDCDAPTGNFYSEYNDYTFFELDEAFFTIHFTVSPDTPAGDYDIPIHFYLLQAQDISDGSDIDESMINLYSTPQITVKRPQEVEFKNGYPETITEINEYYGTPLFTLYRSVVEGDGEILDVYEKNNGEDDEVVHVGPSGFSDRNYVTFEKAGDVEICALVEETEYYLETESCIPVHISKRTRPIESVTVADKEYDGTVDGEIGGIEFEWADLYKDITSDDYEAYVTLDNPNVGNTMATVEIQLTEEAEKRFIIPNNTFRVPARVVPADISNTITAGISPQEYDPSVDYQPVLADVTAEDEGIILEEGVDYELLYGGKKMYSEVQLTEAGTYDITISPLDGSNYTFEPFDVQFEIEQKEVFLNNISPDDKIYDASNETTVSYVILSEESLVEGVDFEAYASLESSDVGTWRGEAYVNLLNTNYYFYDDYETTPGYPEHHSNHTYLNVAGVEIFPRELTNDNTSYELDQTHFTYSGEEIEPFISLSISFVDGEEPEYPLSLGYDYEIEYPADTINYGIKQATITGKGNYCGSIGPIEYFIGMATVQDVQITTPDQTYTGEPLEPEPIITAIFNGERITFPASQYDIQHQEDFIDAGNYTYIAQESNNSNFHFSTTEATFTINPYEISSSDISLSESTYKYNGTSQTPSVTVTVGDTVISGDDYDVEYSSDTIGNDESDTTVTITVTAKEDVNITGSATVTYTITPRDVLVIDGIEDNQQIEYTGSPVALNGNVMVEENEGGIVAGDLTVTWYASDGTTVIDQPVNAGSYKVIYSYEDADYRGALVVNFEITKANSPSPAEMEAGFRIESGKTLADLDGARTNGFAWLDDSTTIVPGSNVYPATYTYNNDTVNYETRFLNVPVYGLARVDITTPDSEGGEITVSSQNVLEGETVTITIRPDFGYILSSITVNGVNRIGEVSANTLTIVAGANDLEIVATFVPIVYEVIEGAEQVYTINEDNGAEFRINANYELFANGGAVYVDDALVGPANYTSWDGSTYIKFTDEYMNTLAVGTHTLKVVFNDGGTATTTFTIAEPDSEDENGDNIVVPNTGFFTTIGGGVTATIGLPVIIFIVLTITRKIQRYKNSKNNT